MPILAQAQQDRFKARVGLGLGNQFNSQGKIVGAEDVKERSLSFEGHYLSYSAYLEKLLSPEWGVAVFTTTTARAKALRNTGVVFNYYTDNDYLFSKQAFVAPYFKLGAAVDSRVDEFNIPFGGGLKWRLGHRINLNVDLTARTYPKHWSEKDANGLSAYSSVALFFNFGAKPRAYRAPIIYASAKEMTRVPSKPVVPAPKEKSVPPVLAVSTDTVRMDTVRADTLRLEDFEPAASKPDSLEGDYKTISQVGDTLVTDSLYVQDTTGAPNPHQGLFARSQDSLLKVEVDLQPKVFFEDSLSKNPDTALIPSGFSAVPAPADSQQSPSAARPRDTVVRISANKYDPKAAAPAQNFKKDSLNLYLSFENQRLREKLATNDKIQSLEERIRTLESRPAPSTSQQPAPSPAPRSTNSTTEVRVVHEDNNKNQAGTALTGAAVGALAAGGRDEETRKELQKLQRKVDSLQWQLAQDRKTAIPVPVVVNAPPGRVDTVVAQNDTAQTARIQKLQNQLSESAGETARLNARLNALNARLDSARVKPVAPPEPEPVKVVIPKAEVFFGNNSSALNAQALANLRSVEEAAEKNPQVKFEILGFTDKSGAVAYNQALSKKRAEAVRDHLLMKGVSFDRLTIKSMGPDESLQEKRSLYGRRVEVVPLAD